jgi:hypothetical protein
MRRASVGIVVLAWVAPAFAQTAVPQPNAALPASPSSASSASADTSLPSPGFAEGMSAYHRALGARRLGSLETLSLGDVRARLRGAEELAQGGRLDEAIARLGELVEHPRFEPFRENDEGRAAIYLLGDTLAGAGAYVPARSYLTRLLTMPGAWDRGAAYAQRAVRRLVDIGLETERWQEVLDDLSSVPSNAKPETRGEVLYLTGRSREAASDPDGASAAYAGVTSASRFWSQATYLRALIAVEHGKWTEGEDLFCKVADPKRQDRSAPVFADERFFAVRDLARLALGRVAHEEGRFDDARYYYYLVPRDSDRLAEALYESATSRYEKKDYDGARELLDQLKGLGVHHRYEDEAWILDAYIDLAQCKFPEADRKLVDFLARYQPVRDAARRVAIDDRLTEALLRAVRGGTDAASTDVAPGVPSDAMRAIGALVRIDPAYGRAARQHAVLEHEASGLRLATAALGDTLRSLATNGGVRPIADETDDARAHDAVERAAEIRAALEGVKRQLADAEGAHLSPAELDRLKEEVKKLEARLAQASGGGGGQPLGASPAAVGGSDLTDLLRADQERAASLAAKMVAARRVVATEESVLARDALRRLDLRLSRLLRRAHLGRIESVLGRKRALEVEVEAIGAGVLPRDAVDSLDAARYLNEGEEYWPFEGDDWPDEFVGGEGK